MIRKLMIIWKIFQNPANFHTVGLHGRKEKMSMRKLNSQDVGIKIFRRQITLIKVYKIYLKFPCLQIKKSI